MIAGLSAPASRPVDEARTAFRSGRLPERAWRGKMAFRPQPRRFSMRTGSRRIRFPGRMIDRVGDRGVEPYITNLTKSLDAERVDPGIGLRNEDDLDRLNVRVYQTITLASHVALGSRWPRGPRLCMILPGPRAQWRRESRVDGGAARYVDHRDEPHPARQRILRYLHLPACDDRGLRASHIRAYAAFAGLVVAATAAMPLLPGPCLG